MRDDRAVELAEDLRVLDEALVRAHEDDAELGQLLLDGVVDDLGVVLGADAGQELPLRLGDAEPLERRLDLLRDVVPGLLLALGRLPVVDDLVEVDLVEAVRPHRHRSLQEVVVGAQAGLEHPVRLVLEPADLLDGRAREAALRLLQVGDVVVERVLVTAVGDEVASGGHQFLEGPARAAGAGSAPWDDGAEVIPSQIIGITVQSVNDVEIERRSRRFAAGLSASPDEDRRKT